MLFILRTRQTSGVYANIILWSDIRTAESVSSPDW